jgi:hypothetical protein
LRRVLVAGNGLAQASRRQVAVAVLEGFLAAGAVEFDLGRRVVGVRFLEPGDLVLAVLLKQGAQGSGVEFVFVGKGSVRKGVGSQFR